MFSPVLAEMGLFWSNFGPGVGGNGSSDLFHPQCNCPEVGGPKLDLGAPKLDDLGAICGVFWGSGASPGPGPRLPLKLVARFY